MSQLKAAIANAHTAAEIAAMQKTETVTAAAATARPEAAAIPRLPYGIGQMVEGEGLFAGVWQPLGKQRYMGLWEWIDLKKEWLVFVAPTDFRDDRKRSRISNFYEAAQEIVSRPQLGHNGLMCLGEGDLHSALINKRYHGEWFIPPLELLCGKDVGGRIVNPQSLFANRAQSSFGFKTQWDPATPKTESEVFYWSCSHPPDSENRYAVDFSTGEVSADPARSIMMNCRPVRLKASAP
jgi:hypothetical protein